MAKSILNGYTAGITAAIATIIFVSGIVSAFDKQGERITVAESRLEAIEKDSERIRSIQMLTIQIAKHVGIDVNLDIEP